MRTRAALSPGSGSQSSPKTEETARVALHEILRGHGCMTAARAFMDALLLHACGVLDLEQVRPSEANLLELEGLVKHEQGTAVLEEHDSCGDVFAPIYLRPRVSLSLVRVNE